jgi:prepilin-type N-terminal cleavage/methylation domain-containing protein
MEPGKHKGFTLFELLTVIAILAILLVGGLTNWMTQSKKAFDAKRKGDLAKIRANLEHYVNDHGCYPTEDLMDSCTSPIFASYNMPTLICDPETKEPYLYRLIDTGNPCLGYRIFAILQRKNDPDIQTLGCDGAAGCGVPDHPEYNYGVATGGTLIP